MRNIQIVANRRKCSTKTRSGKTTRIRLIGVRETSVSQLRASLYIRTSQPYRIEGFKGALNRASIMPRDAILSDLSSLSSPQDGSIEGQVGSRYINHLRSWRPKGFAETPATIDWFTLVMLRESCQHDMILARSTKCPPCRCWLTFLNVPHVACSGWWSSKSRRGWRVTGVDQTTAVETYGERVRCLS